MNLLIDGFNCESRHQLREKIKKIRFFWHKIPAVDSAIHKVAPQYFIIFTISLEYI